MPMRKMYLWCPIIKRKEIIIWTHVYPNWKMKFNAKIGRKRSFSYKAKASISFIPIRRMCLWFPIMITKEIIIWIHVYPNWSMTFSSKKGRKWNFSYETKASMSFILIKRMSLQCPIMKRKEIIIWICVYPNWQINIKSKKWWKEKFFLWNQCINVIYPNE